MRDPAKGFASVETKHFCDDVRVVGEIVGKLLQTYLAVDAHESQAGTSREEEDFAQPSPLPVDAAEISRTLDIPVRLLRQILFELVEAGVVSEAKTQQEKEPAYQPGRDAEWLTVKHVIDALEEHGNDTLPVAKSANYEKISDSLNTFSQTINNSPANLLLKEI